MVGVSPSGWFSSSRIFHLNQSIEGNQRPCKKVLSHRIQVSSVCPFVTTGLSGCSKSHQRLVPSAEAHAPSDRVQSDDDASVLHVLVDVKEGGIWIGLSSTAFDLSESKGISRSRQDRKEEEKKSLKES